MPARTAGYGGGPLTYQAWLLDEPLFRLGHLSSCVQSEEAEELLLGADHDAACDFRRRLRERAEWPAFTEPLAADHRLHVVYRTVADDTGVDYLLHHPDWGQAELLEYSFRNPASLFALSSGRLAQVAGALAP